MQEKSVYRGIEYVRLGDLPAEEREQIKNWLGSDSIIKIKTDSELMIDCVQYKEYEQWFKTIYTNAEGLSQEQQVAKSKVMNAKRSTGLAFD